MENPIVNNHGRFEIDHIQLRENLMNVLVKHPKSINKLAKEINMSAKTIRHFIKGGDILLESAFKLTKYINETIAKTI